MLAWLRGLKTTYYLRTTSATGGREVDHPEPRAERRLARRGRDLQRPGPRRRRRTGQHRGTGHGRQVLRHRRPGLRSLPVRHPLIS